MALSSVSCQGLSFLRNGRDVLMVFVTSLVIWLLETVKYWLIMQGFMFAPSASSA